MTMKASPPVVRLPCASFASMVKVVALCVHRTVQRGTIPRHGRTRAVRTEGNAQVQGRSTTSVQGKAARIGGCHGVSNGRTHLDATPSRRPSPYTRQREASGGVSLIGSSSASTREAVSTSIGGRNSSKICARPPSTASAHKKFKTAVGWFVCRTFRLVLCMRHGMRASDACLDMQHVQTDHLAPAPKVPEHTTHAPT